MRTCLIRLIIVAFLGHTSLWAQDDVVNDQAAIRSIRLRVAIAADVASILNDQYPVKFSESESTNTVYGRVPSGIVEDVEDFVERLERDAERVRVEQQHREQEHREQTARRKQEQLPKPTSTQIKVFRLSHADPVEVMIVLSNLGFYENDIAISQAPQDGSLLARGTPEAISKLQVLIEEIDVPGSKPAPDTNQTIKTLEQSLLSAQLQHHELLVQMGTDHPQAKMLERKMEHMRGLLEQQRQKLAGRQNPLTQDTAGSLRAAYESSERAAAKLADQWRRESADESTTEDALAELRNKISMRVSRAFELRQQLKRQEIAAASAQLDAIRSRLDMRQEIADEIVQRRVEDLIRGVDVSWLSATDSGDEGIDESVIPSDAPQPQTLGEALKNTAKRTDGDVNIQLLENLDTIIVRGKKQDVQRVVDVLDSIQSASTPKREAPKREAPKREAPKREAPTTISPPTKQNSGTTSFPESEPESEKEK